MKQEIIIVISPDDAPLATQIQQQLKGSEIINIARAKTDGFTTIKQAIAHFFSKGHPIIGLCASGILIRSVAPILSDKFTDPPLIAITPDAKAVIPLLGGHHGGNQLAAKIAQLITAPLIATSKGDNKLGFSLDMPPENWYLRGKENVKGAMARLIDGEKLNLYDPDNLLTWAKADYFNSIDKAEKADIIVTYHDMVLQPEQIIFHPPILALGIGCERHADADIMYNKLLDFLKDNALASKSIAVITSLDLKMDEESLHYISKKLACPLRFFSATHLEKYDKIVPNPSSAVKGEVGCASVSEASALAILPTQQTSASNLIYKKQKFDIFTLAIAKSCHDIDVNKDNKAMKIGRLDIVGTGPGDRAYRSIESEQILRMADDVVGYQLYLSLVDDLIHGARHHSSPLGAEEERVRHALNLAATGRRVALVCSGDPGIYALATLAFEVIEKENNRTFNSIHLAVHPGISAFQLLSARLGAPFGHDFCLISLSDLLTPISVIEKRLKAMAEGDFNVAFYNPQSKGRRKLLPLAVQILQKHRPPNTPVMIGKNLGRADEEISVVKLKDFSAEQVDMLTLVMVGNSETRHLLIKGENRTFTPRGYSKKHI